MYNHNRTFFLSRDFEQHAEPRYKFARHGFAIRQEWIRSAKLESSGFSLGFRRSANRKAERIVSARFTNDKTRTARALARAYLVTLGEYININYLIS